VPSIRVTEEGAKQDKAIELTDGRRLPLKEEGLEMHDVPEKDTEFLADRGWAETFVPSIEDLSEEGEPEELGEVEEEPEITDAQRKRFFSLADEVFESDGDRKDWLREEFGTDSVKNLGHGQMNSAIAKLDKEAGEVTYESGRQTLKQMDRELEEGRKEAKEVGIPQIIEPESVKEYVDKVEELIEKVIDMKPHQKGGDIYYIGDDGSPTTNIEKAVSTYIGRSGLRKLALACNLEVEPVRKEKLEHEDYYTWVFKVRVKMPNGRTYVQEGACSSNEAFFTSGKGQVEEKDIVHTAETRAMNRAIMDVIGAPNIGREQWAEG